MENQTSTWLSQLAWVGVKWKCTFLWRASQRSCLGLCVLRLSSTTWILGIGVGCDDLVHEVEELAPTASLVVGRLDQAGGHLEGGEQRRGSMALVLVGEAGEALPVGQPQPALGPLERLDRGLLVDADDDGVLGWVQIEPHDVGGLGGELGIGAQAPAAASSQADAVAGQDAPDVDRTDIPQLAGQQVPGPGGVTRRRVLVEQREDASLGLGAVDGTGTGAWGIGEAREAIAGEAGAPLRDPCGPGAEALGDLGRAEPLIGGEDDAGSIDVALLRGACSQPALQGLSFLFRQHDGRGGFRHAASVAGWLSHYRPSARVSTSCARRRREYEIGRRPMVHWCHVLITSQSPGAARAVSGRRPRWVRGRQGSHERRPYSGSASASRSGGASPSQMRPCGCPSPDGLRKLVIVEVRPS